MVCYPLSATGDNDKDEAGRLEREIIRFHQRQLRKALKQQGNKITQADREGFDLPRNGSKS